MYSSNSKNLLRGILVIFFYSYFGMGSIGRTLSCFLLERFWFIHNARTLPEESDHVMYLFLILANQGQIVGSGGRPKLVRSCKPTSYDLPLDSTIYPWVSGDACFLDGKICCCNLVLFLTGALGNMVRHSPSLYQQLIKTQAPHGYEISGLQSF